MCFRPSEIAGALSCPSCGKRVFAVNDVFPQRCPFCKEELADAVEALKSGAGAPAPAAPSVPGAPAAPAAPVAPKPPEPKA